MSDRCGSSRSLGVVKQCAVYERGGRRCVWCTRALRAPRTDGGRDTATASIDHVDGNGYDHNPANLVPSCRTCNSYRAWPEMWGTYLAAKGQTVEGAAARAAEQTARPLDYAAGRALARRWHPERFAMIAKCRRTYELRRAGKLAHATDFPTEEQKTP